MKQIRKQISILDTTSPYRVHAKSVDGSCHSSYLPADSALSLYTASHFPSNVRGRNTYIGSALRESALWQLESMAASRFDLLLQPHCTTQRIALQYLFRATSVFHTHSQRHRRTFARNYGLDFPDLTPTLLDGSGVPVATGQRCRVADSDSVDGGETNRTQEQERGGKATRSSCRRHHLGDPLPLELHRLLGHDVFFVVQKFGRVCLFQLVYSDHLHMLSHLRKALELGFVHLDDDGLCRYRSVFNCSDRAIRAAVRILI